MYELEFTHRQYTSQIKKTYNSCSKIRQNSIYLSYCDCDLREWRLCHLSFYDIIEPNCREDKFSTSTCTRPGESRDILSIFLSPCQLKRRRTCSWKWQEWLPRMMRKDISIFTRQNIPTLTQQSNLQKLNQSALKVQWYDSKNICFALDMKIFSISSLITYCIHGHGEHLWLHERYSPQWSQPEIGLLAGCISDVYFANPKMDRCGW